MPHLMYQNGRLDVLNIQPGHPTNLNCPYRISKRSGDGMISILHNGESGSILFYAIYLKEGI